MNEPNSLPEWAGGLPDEIKPIVQTKGWKTPADIIGSYTNLEKTLGTKRLQSPSADWRDDQWDGFWKEVGRPEKPDDYKVPEFKFPDGVAMDENRLKEAKAAIHAAGLHPRQAEKVMQYYFDMVAKDATAVQEARRREMEAAEFRLKDEWRGDYDLNIKVGKDALAKFGGPELVDFLNQSGLGNNPALIKAFAAIGKGMMEDTARGKAQQPGGGSATAEAAQKEIAAMRADQTFMQKFMTGDKEAREKWEQAFKMAYPEPQRA